MEINRIKIFNIEWASINEHIIVFATYLFICLFDRFSPCRISKLGALYIDQFVLELTEIFLPLLPLYWDKSCVAPPLAITVYVLTRSLIPLAA